jgi:AcrR family transcriptional regulator
MGRKANYIRKEVLEKAMELFWRKGYEGTHLAELVEYTGLNRFSLYKEFNGKEGIFSEALEMYLESSMEYYSVLKRAPLGKKNIFNYFESMEFTGEYLGCFAVNSLTEQFNINSNELIKVKNFFEEVEKDYFINLVAAQKDGELGQDKDAKSLAKIILSLDMGLALYGHIAKNKKELQNLIKTLKILII